ncbi:MAG: DUF1573 domain-containing protein [Desulfobacterium sp.]|nr:DUF1573 domain-containing protein [Desulfobacterium sp.]MBU3948500.1 DUF1573 domain-containing protein [Pseudomonadota bacterium]
MKHKIVVACFSVFLLILSYSHSHGDNGQDQPNAVIPNSSYEFDQIPEGTKVVHDFVVQNTGKAPLEIYQVITG